MERSDYSRGNFVWGGHGGNLSKKWNSDNLKCPLKMVMNQNGNPLKSC